MQHKWWVGYDGHETILIDDICTKSFKFPELLRILDRYPKRLEIKGGFRQLNSKNIIITCPWSPEELFKVRNQYHPEDIKQLTWRIDKILFLPQSRESGNTIPTPTDDLLLSYTKSSNNNQHSCLRELLEKHNTM
jgi:hypothetical protein